MLRVFDFSSAAWNSRKSSLNCDDSKQQQQKKLIFIFSIRIAGLLRNLSRPHRERSLLWNTELGNSFTILPQPEQKSSRCKVVTQQNTLKNRVFVNHSSKLWRSRKHIRSRSRVWSFSGVNTMSELCSPKEKKKLYRSSSTARGETMKISVQKSSHKTATRMCVEMQSITLKTSMMHVIARKMKSPNKIKVLSYRRLRFMASSLYTLA